ncbi:hypothetical protein [Myroides guanonis]|uniref:Uncharacterized protein n=1 Tax=Myroides guanonis TaxID=1150112 RepID=A0A1I3S4V4_9FLAO|nr:hypothetical protein [Myroides guanonis]SFJ53082.1 hypothetical protein SAMN04487893_109110 [Myroides guanonis]
MKSKKVSLDANLWTNRNIECPYELIREVFLITNIEHLKGEITNCFYYALKLKLSHRIKISDLKRDLFIMRSLMKASYNILLDSKENGQKELVKKDNESIKDGLGALNFEEYQNPYIVFQNVFKRTTLMQVDDLVYDLIEVISYKRMTDYSNHSIPAMFSHKILEACWLINERLKEKY